MVVLHLSGRLPVEAYGNNNLHRPESWNRPTGLPTGVDSVLREIAFQLHRLSDLQSHLQTQLQDNETELESHAKQVMTQFLQSLQEGMNSARQQSEQMLANLAQLEPRHNKVTTALEKQIAGLMDAQTQLVNAQVQFSGSIQQMNAQSEKERSVSRTADALVNDSVRFEESAKPLYDVVSQWQSCVERSTPLFDALHADSQKTSDSIGQVRSTIASSFASLEHGEGTLTNLQGKLDSVLSVLGIIDDIAEQTN
ncbi:MAG: hypothetical protein RIR26_1885, partial [Pseudomonadota bacterium]